MSQPDDSFNERYNSALLQTLHSRGIQMRTPRKAYLEHRQIVDSWPTKIDTAAKVLKSKNLISVDLTLKSGKAERQFRELGKAKKHFNEIIGGDVKWERGPNERHIIAVLPADPTNESDWPRQHAWLAAKLVAFRIAFEPAIRRLTTR